MADRLFQAILSCRGHVQKYALALDSPCLTASLQPRIEARMSLPHGWPCGWEENGGGWHLTVVYDTILSYASTPSGAGAKRWESATWADGRVGNQLSFMLAAFPFQQPSQLGGLVEETNRGSHNPGRQILWPMTRVLAF